MLDKICRNAIESSIRGFVKRKQYLDFRNISISKDLTKASIIVLSKDEETEDFEEELLLFNVHLNISHCMHKTEIEVGLSLFEEC